MTERYSDPLAPEPANPYHFTGPKVFLLSKNETDHSAVLAVNGKKYEYFFLSNQHLDTLSYLFRKVTSLAALNYAKKHSEKEVRL